MLSTTWQVLNGLRKPDGRLAYNSYRNGYDLYPQRRVVGKGVVTDLLERGFITRAPGEQAAVYHITDAGRAAWERTPENVYIYGVCDGCEIATAVRPKRLGHECVYLCDRCVARELEEGNGFEATPATQKL